MKTLGGCSWRNTNRFVSRRRLSSTAAPNIVDELTARGLVAAVTSRSLRAHLEKPRGVYLGFDPTAQSLHLGNLVALIGLLHFQLHGHDTVALVGGATGAIGDPSGRSSERQALEKDVLQHNTRHISSQLTGFFDQAVPFALSRRKNITSLGQFSIKNNVDWLGKLSLIDFLSGSGKRARVSSMLARDSVKNRLSSTAGISFTEFTYNLLQAYDFQHLHAQHNVTVQLGGSDQYGNIMAGIELFQKSDPPAPNKEESSGIYGLTMPLLTSSTGEKFGKSAGNAIWLSDQLTSPFDVYQYFLRTSDTDVETYLKTFTFLPLETIQETVTEHEKDRTKKLAQATLAKEATELIHGASGLNRAELATSILFNPSVIQDAMVNDIVTAIPHTMVQSVRPDQVIGQKFADVCVLTSLAPSKKAARQLISSGGLRVFGKPITDPEQAVATLNLRGNKLLLLQSGKGKFKALVLDENATEIAIKSAQ